MDKSKAKLNKDGFELVNGYRITKKATPAGTRYVVDLGMVEGKHIRKQFSAELDARNEAKNAKLRQKKYGEKVLQLTTRKRNDAFAALGIAEEFDCTLLQMAEFYARHHKAVDKNTSTSELVDAYFKHQEEEMGRGNLRPASLESSRFFVESFRKAFGNMSIDCIDHEDLNKFLDDIPSLPSRKSHRVYMSAFLNWVIRYRDVLKVNPILRTNKVTLPQGDPEAYAVDDVKKLMDNAPDKLVPYLTLGLFCGLRTTESLRVRWENIDFKRKRIALPGASTKKGRTRYIDLEANAYHLLNQYKQKGGLVVPSYAKKVQRWLRDLAAEQGVKLIHSGCRHSYATYHLAKYNDIDSTRKAMGHRGFKILEDSYADYAKAFGEDAVEYFNIGLPQKKVVDFPKAKTA